MKLFFVRMVSESDGNWIGSEEGIERVKYKPTELISTKSISCQFIVGMDFVGDTKRSILL